MVLEGTLIFANEKLRELIDLKIFLDTDEDIRLSKRIYKACCQNSKDINSCVESYLQVLKPLHEKFVLPSKKFANIIIPNYGCVSMDFYKGQSIGFLNRHAWLQHRGKLLHQLGRQLGRTAQTGNTPMVLLPVETMIFKY